MCGGAGREALATPNGQRRDPRPHGPHIQGEQSAAYECVESISKPTATRTVATRTSSSTSNTSTNRRGISPFDLASTGAPRRIPWPRTAGDVWLVLDRNGNGTIDDGREMFGNFTRLADGTPAPNGYVALAEWDTSGDGRLTAADMAFGQLRLWLDRVRNGVTDTGELIALGDAGIVELSLRYKESKRTDRWGNVFKYRSNVRFSSGDMRHAWDVYFPVPPRETNSSSVALASTSRQCRAKSGMASAIARNVGSQIDLR